MKKDLYSICDVKTGIFYPPMEFTNRNDCMRGIGDDLRHRDTIMSRHPEDFNVHYVGTFDDETGVVTPNQVRAVSFTCASLLEDPKNANQ